MGIYEKRNGQYVRTDTCGASGGGEDKRLKKNIEYLLIYSKSNTFKSFNPIYKNQNLISYIEERRSENKSFRLHFIVNGHIIQYFF